MFLQMLKDEFPDVRLHIISKLELVNQGTIFQDINLVQADINSDRH